MLRRIQSIGIALAIAAVGVVALPAGGVGATPIQPLAVIYPDGDANGVVGCRLGTDQSFSGAYSFNPLENTIIQPMRYTWTWPGGGADGVGLTEVSIPCLGYEFEISLTVDNSVATDRTTVRMRPNKDPVAVISRDGTALGEETYAAVGTSFTLGGELSSDPEGGELSNEWFSSIQGRLQDDVGGASVTVRCPYEEEFTVTQVVWDEEWFRAAADVLVKCVPEPTFTPTPLLSGQRRKIAQGSTVNFVSQGLDGVASWRTTGVPGVAFEGPVFTRTFDKPGDFGVQMNGNSVFGPVKVWAGYTVIAPPTVSVTPAPAGLTDRMTVVAGSTITFDGSASRSPGGAPLWMEWRTTGKPGVVSTARSYTRTFDTPGLFGVQLNVLDEVGQRAQRWVGLNVVPAAPPVVKVTPAPADPTGRMKAKVGDTITFDGSGSTSPSGLGLTYAWRTTGLPGVVATTKSYTRKFDKAGLFGVELVVTDSSGQQAKRWVGLTVEP